MYTFVTSCCSPHISTSQQKSSTECLIWCRSGCVRILPFHTLRELCLSSLLGRGGTWRERVTRTRMRITLILYNFPESSTFCEIFTFKFRSVYADCQRLREIVQDSAINFYFSESCQPSCNVKRRRRRLPVFIKILCIYLWN